MPRESAAQEEQVYTPRLSGGYVTEYGFEDWFNFLIGSSIVKGVRRIRLCQEGSSDFMAVRCEGLSEKDLVTYTPVAITVNRADVAFAPSLLHILRERSTETLKVIDHEAIGNSFHGSMIEQDDGRDVQIDFWISRSKENLPIILEISREDRSSKIRIK